MKSVSALDEDLCGPSSLQFRPDNSGRLAMFPSPSPLLRPSDMVDNGRVLRNAISVFSYSSLPRTQPELSRLIGIVDSMGENSARAQRLRSAVTTVAKLHHNPSHKIYIMRSESPTGDTGDTAIDAGENDAPTIADLERSGTTRAREKQYQVLGFLKIGVKCLFVSDDIGRQIQISPLCLLDFYITETHQRLGYGKTLFECMLANEGVSASKLAYDRPSPRMVGFLKKHYALQETLPQANNYLFFKEFGFSSIEKSNQPRTLLHKRGSISTTLKRPIIRSPIGLPSTQTPEQAGGSHQMPYLTHIVSTLNGERPPIEAVDSFTLRKREDFLQPPAYGRRSFRNF